MWGMRCVGRREGPGGGSCARGAERGARCAEWCALARIIILVI